MRVFSNPVGAGSLWFHNLATADGVAVGYDPQARGFISVPPFCANRENIGCNWIAPEEGALCRSCAMTTVTPDTMRPDALANWAQTEAAKRWVLDGLGRWHWFRPEDRGTPPCFHMRDDGPTPAAMGHVNGVVTISVAEADPVLRTTRREALDEPYRTMIGHFRHEIAHMLWWRLSLRADFLEAFRQVFGDERADYTAALQRHYETGPPADWMDRHLTTYASSHPHEDWAETATHLLNLIDITDSAMSAGLVLTEMREPGWDAYAETDAMGLLRTALRVVAIVNHANRAVGLDDAYPFVVSARAQEKLAFVHEWLRRGAFGR